MNVVIVDYGAGNLRSAAKAFEAASSAGTRIRVSADPGEVRMAERLVLPGVGAFADCRNGLAARPGLIEAMSEVALKGGRPFLGICVGMQLMASVGVEFGETTGLDWIPGRVELMRPLDRELRIPQMGWNELEFKAPRHPVLAGLAEGDHAYFVHSFAFRARDSAQVLAEVEYGGRIVAAIGRDNLVGVQFHPEKSQHVGLRLIANFLGWRP
jgi:glutamine amidotransferase